MQVAMGLREQMKINKKFKVVRCHGVLDIVSVPNGRIPLCGGYVLFELAHTLWGINRFMCL
jgi:hypothetical protein